MALAHSHGDFIQYLDADDLLSADKISRQVRRLTGNETCIATAEWGRFYSHPSEARFAPDATWTDLPPLDWLARSGENGLGMMYPALWLIPRGIVEQVGPWNAELGRARGEDMEYFTRIVLKASKVLFCSGARTYYRSGIGGASASQDFGSQVRVYDLCQRYILASEDSERMRIGFAKSWQHLAHLSYPYDRAVEAGSRIAPRYHQAHGRTLLRDCIGGPRLEGRSAVAAVVGSALIRFAVDVILFAGEPGTSRRALGIGAATPRN